MGKTINELIGLVVGLVKKGTSIDDLYSYVSDKFKVESREVLDDFNSVVERYKGKYISIGEGDEPEILMYVKDINFSKGSAREYEFIGSSIELRVDSDNSSYSSVNYDIDNYYYFSSDELSTRVAVLTLEEAMDLFTKLYNINSERTRDMFFK